MKLTLNFRSGIAPLTLDIEQEEEEVLRRVKDAIEHGKILDLTDSSGDRVLIPATNIGYAAVPARQSTPIGFGRLV